MAFLYEVYLVELLGAKDAQNKKLITTLKDYDTEIEFLRSENEKNQLALDLAKANLARQSIQDEDEEGLVSDLQDKIQRKDEGRF